MLVGMRGPYLLVIQPDDMAPNPREDDNFGRMVCFHPRYDLGDRHNYLDNDDFLRELYLNTVGHNERGALQYERMVDMAWSRAAPESNKNQAVLSTVLRKVQQKYIMLPLYLYDHSGITMNTTGFSCPWDSGQVGWVYASKEAALREFGGTKMTAGIRKQAEDCMRAEVEYYDAYLRGDSYGFELYKDGELYDSVWGFTGSDFDEVRQDIEFHLPDTCKGITDKLTEQNDPRSMIKMLMKHARMQIEQAEKDHAHMPQQHTLAAEAR